MTYKLYIIKDLKPTCISQDEGNEGDTCARMQGNGKKNQHLKLKHFLNTTLNWHLGIKFKLFTTETFEN